ncbi:MAG: recombinase family protein [Planctomycetes bacterium]|nr:recombinase family protein [Planctomycetota bacterium]
MGRAWTYARSEPETDSNSLEGVAQQLRSLEAYARLRGLRVERKLSDEVPVGMPFEARPGGGALVSALREERGVHVLVFHLERAFASVSECLALEREWEGRGHVLHVADLDGTSVHTQSGLGRFMLSVLSSAQTMEASGRGLARLKHPRRAGEKPLLGERVVRGYVVPDPDELRAVQRIIDLHGEGKSLREIAETLDGEGVPTKRRAKAWSKEAIRLIMLRVENGEVRSLRKDEVGSLRKQP